MSSIAALSSSVSRLADALNDALPQTQCTRCGYPDCRAYAQAVACGEADINQCPPGGDEGIVRLARISGRPWVALNPNHGVEGPRAVVRIDEAWCIGCTLCIQACPVDCIVGAPKLMHTVVESQCTGCELCISACPVDCIALVPVTGQRTGWSAWSTEQAAQARARHEARGQRRAAAEPEPPSPDDTSAQRKSSVIEAALARARAAQR
ncbi:MAG: electron transport complex subunit RsxB [Burkholderiaceae bacterium]